MLLTRTFWLDNSKSSLAQIQVPRGSGGDSSVPPPAEVPRPRDISRIGGFQTSAEPPEVPPPKRPMIQPATATASRSNTSWTLLYLSKVAEYDLRPMIWGKDLSLGSKFKVLPPSNTVEATTPTRAPVRKIIIIFLALLRATTKSCRPNQQVYPGMWGEKSNEVRARRPLLEVEQEPPTPKLNQSRFHKGLSNNFIQCHS